MPPSDFSHRVERTRNKHSRAVYQNDTIVIRLAKNLSKGEEREHIDNLLRRMTKQVLKERDKRSIDPFRSLLEGEPELTLALPSGQSYVFRLMPGPRTKTKRTAEGFDISIAPDIRRGSLHRYLWSLLGFAEQERTMELVRRIDRETYQDGIARVRLAYAASQWGSCSRHGVIMLNTVLLLLPTHLLEYVIVHELAHRRYPNHSDAYWRHVSRFCPFFEQARKELHQYRICSL